MTIKTSDYNFLCEFYEKIKKSQKYQAEVERLRLLLDNLTADREKQNAKTRAFIAEKRKTNKNYARSRVAKHGH